MVVGVCGGRFLILSSWRFARPCPRPHPPFRMWPSRLSTSIVHIKSVAKVTFFHQGVALCAAYPAGAAAWGGFRILRGWGSGTPPPPRGGSGVCGGPGYPLIPSNPVQCSCLVRCTGGWVGHRFGTKLVPLGFRFVAIEHPFGTCSHEELEGGGM